MGRIVKISDMTDEEKEKWKQQVNTRYQEGLIRQQQEQERVNKLYNNFNNTNLTEDVKIRNLLNNSANNVLDRNKEALKRKNIIDKSLYVDKKAGAGLITGTVGIGQAGLTDMASKIDEGSKQDTGAVWLDLLANATLGPAFTGTAKAQKDSIDLLNDNSKNGWEKALQLGLNTSSYALDYFIPGKALADSVLRHMGHYNPQTKDLVMEANNFISKPVEEMNMQLAKEGEEYDKVTQLLGDAGHSIGNMAPSIIATAVTKNPTIGLAVMGASAKGQATQEALNKGATLEQAKKIGDAKMWIEVGTEKLTGGLNYFGKGWLDNFTETGLNKIKNDIVRKFAEKGLDIGEEIGEETISDLLGFLIDKGTVDPNAEYTWEDWLDTATTTAISTYGMNKINSGIQKIAEKSANNDLIYMNENQTTTKNSNSIKDMAKNIASSMLNSNQNKNIAILNNNTTNNVLTSQNQDNINLPIRTLTYNESAKKYNIDVNNKTVQAIKNVTEARDIKAKYDADIFNGSNEEAIWRVDDKGNREIIINPLAQNQEKTLQNIVVHELFHDFDGTKQKQILTQISMEKMQKQEGFSNAIKSLREAYSKVYDGKIDLNSEEFNNLIKEEATAKFLGENLGNQEFVTELVNRQNRNTVQKIYDWVVNKVQSLKNKVTGDYEAEYWRIVKNNFEKAFNQKYQGNTNTMLYSIAGEKAVNNLIRNNPVKYIKLEQQYNKARQMKKNNIDNETIREKTDWFQDKNGDWKFEFSDKHMSLKPNIKLKENKTYKLSDILEHDTLFMAYPELADYKVKFIENNKKKGKFESDKNKISINSRMLNFKDSSKLVEGTLIHEIQHAIQNLEGFESGKSSFSKQEYYNSLGEIEADNTKQRFIQEKYDNKDITDIAPESSKENPQHRNINILNNETTIDKIKDKIYNSIKNYLKNKGDNYEDYEENLAENIEKDIRQNRRNDNVGRHLNMEESENNSGSFNLPINRKYLQNTSFDKFVKKNSINKGTGETIEQVKLPIADKTMKDIGVPTNKSIYSKNKVNTEILTKANHDVKDKKLTRKEIKKQLLEEMDITAEDLQIGDDITNINYQITDPIRVNEKVFGLELGQKINDATINQTKHNTAEKIRWLNKERDEIRELDIKARSKESAAVQKYGEKQYVDSKGNTYEYGDLELMREFPNTQTQTKIKKAAEVLRNKYDLYLEQINDVITALGYDEIPKRKDYMRHFQELGDTFSKTGIPFNLNDMKAEDLPTDINGLTELNKPGKNWFAQAQVRYGNKTTYDAITGIDGYLEGAGNLIYHTKDIQNYRALSSLVRDTFGKTKGFENLEGLTDKQMQQRIEDIQSNKLSRYAAWLDEQANSLAGKKGAIDRGIERIIGRRAYTFMNTLKSQVGSNMTGFNVRSSLTNFISTTIAGAKTNKIALAKGTVSTINNMFHNDSFIDKSDFLTTRFGSETLSQKVWQKISNAGQIFMSGSDYFTSNIIARSKYFEGLQRGMTEVQALKYSNDFSSRVMGDRSQGATAEVFNSKTLGLLTQFQLEVNNQWQYMIHDTRMDYQKNSKTDGKVKAGANVVFQLGQIAAYSYFFNEFFEALTGSRAAFDPIEIIKVLFGIDDDDDDEKPIDERISEATGLLVDNIPLGNLITGGGRIPISESLEGLSTLTKKLTNQKNDYGEKISWEDVGKDLLSSIPYWILPTGYGQIKKTTQGLNTVINNGDYNVNSKGEKELKFPVENKNTGDYIKAGLFGKYALPISKEYTDRDYKKLSANQTKTYEETKLPYKEYLEYLDENLDSTEDKIQYISSKEYSIEQKWVLYKNDIFSTAKRKDGTSQLSDIEYIVSNGVSKKDFIEMYNKMQKYDIDVPSRSEYEKIQDNDIKLKNYVEYKIEEKKQTKNKQKIGELKENQQLKTCDKIQILLDSKYPQKEKMAIYENYIISSNDKEFKFIKASNINFEEYLKFKQQDFISDKTDDGTLNGKTVSKSKQKKVTDYLNDVHSRGGITGNQSLLLYAMQGYSTTSKQKNQLVNYITNLDLKPKEKAELFNKFSGFTVYKDGNIQW